MSKSPVTAPQSTSAREKSEHRGTPITSEDVLRMASIFGVALSTASCLGGSVVNASQATEVGPEVKKPTLTTPSITTPEPSRAPTATPQPVEGLMTGLYYGLRKDTNGKDTFVGGISGKSIDDGLKAKGLSGYTVPTVGGFYGVEVNTYYSKNDPNQPAAFSFDDQYLMKYFNVTTGKDGSMKGQIPGDGVVEKKGNMWVATIGGKQMVLNPFVMSRAGEKFGAPVILEKGGALFFALVDPKTGGLVTDPQNAFQEPGAVAKANGYKGTQPVGSVELTRSGLMVVKGPDGKFLAELKMTTNAITLEQWVQTSTPDTKLLQQAQAAYAKAMGIDVSKIETSVQMKVGINGPYAVVMDKTTGTPLLITERSKEGFIFRSVGYKDFAPLKMTIGGAMTNRGGLLTADPRYKSTFEGLFNLGVNDGALSTGSLFKNIKTTKDIHLTPEQAIAQYYWGDFDKVMENLEGSGIPTRVQSIDFALKISDAPDWMKQFTDDELRTYIKLHAKAILDRTNASEVVAVNEAFWHDNTFSGMPGNNFLNSRLKQSYIALEVQAVKEAKPKAKIIVNENFTSQGDTHTVINNETMKFFEVIKQLKATGVPIDAVGIQSHILARDFLRGDIDKNIAEFKRQNIQFMQMFKQINTETLVTELDVNIGGLPSDWTQQQKEQLKAKIYRAVFEAAIESKNCSSVTTWGYMNGATWMTTNYPYKPAESPLPIDEKYEPTAAYYYILQYLFEQSLTTSP